MLDPVDLRGIPWRDGDNRTRWAPPDFLPPTDSSDLWLVNLEELPSGVPMVQAALFQLVRDRKCGEYQLPEGASLMACGNRESDRGVVHRMPTPAGLALRSPRDQGRPVGLVRMGSRERDRARDPLLHPAQARAASTSSMLSRARRPSHVRGHGSSSSNVVNQRGGLDPAAERALFRGAVGEAAAVEFSAFLKVWRELPHPRAVIDDPENADVPDNASALIALCGSLYRMADDVNLGSIVSYAMRLRREVGEFLVGSCIRREPDLQRTDAFIRWAAARTQ